MSEKNNGVISYPEGEPVGNEEKPFVVTYPDGEVLEGVSSAMDNKEWEKVASKDLS